MKHKILLSFMALTFIFAAFAFSQRNADYSSSWRRVSDYESRSLPQSAAEEVNNILRRAINDRNSPQVIKALIHQARFDLVIDAQNNTGIFENLNEMLARSTDAVETAVLHSMLGELYLQFYQQDRWNIDRRSPLGDFVPEDMREWTRNIFFDHAVKHLNASLQPQRALENAQVATFAAVVNLGSDSRRFFPTMYDFLARRAINVFAQIGVGEDLGRSLGRKGLTIESLFVPANEFVQLPLNPQPTDYNLWRWEIHRQHLSSLQNREMRESVLLTELEVIRNLEGFSSWERYSELALPLLERILTQWEEQPMSVEIIDRIAAIREREIRQIADESVRKTQMGEFYEMLQNTVRRFSRYERISIIQNRIAQLTHPSVSVSGNSTFPQNGVKELTISFQNMRSFNARLYRINPISLFNANQNRNANRNRTFVKNIPISLPSLPAYWRGTTTITLDINEFGAYELVFVSPAPDNVITNLIRNVVAPENSPTWEEMNSYFFVVSDLAVFARGTSDTEAEFFVVNRMTGEPIPNAQIEIYRSRWQGQRREISLSETISTNAQGLAVVNRSRDRGFTYHYRAVLGNDAGTLLADFPREFTVRERPPSSGTDIQLFTDRSIYRPGQIVHFKGIVTVNDSREQTLMIPNQEFTIGLYDANNQEVSTKALTTNAFGSISGEFILPQNLLAGQFSIRPVGRNATLRGNVSFRVEEYRRPTFEITFEQIEETYRFGEEVVLRGSADMFSGVRLQNATVTYRITRQQTMWGRFFGSGAPEHFATGSVTTDEAGGFEIRFTPERPDAVRWSRNVYTFAVEAVITSASGETQIGNRSIRVGDVSMTLNIDIPAQWEKSSTTPIVISAQNLDGNDISARGTFEIFSLNEDNSTNRQVAQGNFTTGEQNDLRNQLRRLDSGRYRIQLQSTDDRGNEIETERNFILFSYTDRRPPIQTNEWLVRRSTTFGANRNAEIIFGVSDRVHVLRELWQGDRLLEREWMLMNNENRTFTFRPRPEFRNGITLKFTYVKNEQFFAHSIEMLPEQEVRELNVRLDVFRDRIRPGTEEEWRISVTDRDGNPAIAEILASMYDMSLDNIFAHHAWHFNRLIFNQYRSMMHLRSDNTFSTQHAFGRFRMPNRDIRSFEFDSFNWFGFGLDMRSRRMLQSTMLRAASSRERNEMEMATSDMIMESAEEEVSFAMAPPPTTADMYGAGAVAEMEDSAEWAQGERQTQTAPQIRRDFSETAFFFPQLRTNRNGDVQIAFTVPESNTRWRFRVLAHDKNLNIGQSEAFAVSQKELMVTPNIPRFLRQGDRTSISTKISNLSDGTINGNVRIEFFDVMTEKIVTHISPENRTQSFSILQNGSTDASWIFDVPTDIDLIGIRIIAESAQFSDGEQHALAVLPNRMMVTESVRMDVHGNQTRAFEMSRLTQNASPTAENFRLTLSFTSNPAWYAIQALPVLGEPQNESATAWFASFYANTLGAHIGNAYPQVRRMIEAWQAQGGTAETLISNLERNQELKTVLLEETPWVLQAQNETEQMQRLSLLFDLNRSRNLTSTALRQLQELQTSEGGWSWFRGFRPSVSITQYILFGFAQLAELQAITPTSEIYEMQARAVAYIDREALRRFENLQRNNRNWRNITTIRTVDLEYLLVRSAYSHIPLSREVQAMTDFYMSVIQQNWTRFDLYQRSHIVVLMQRAGNTRIVTDILNSYREHATISDEMGMFWANNRAHVFMSQSAVSVHTFIMNAFRVGGATDEEMDNMKRWLLKQKQVQQWESTHATVDAIYALLSTGSDWFSTQGTTTITLGGQVIEPARTEIGTGSFTESWNRTEIRPEMGNVTVAHTGNAPAWGALYLQYFEYLDNIEGVNASLDVEKQLFVEQTDASGRRLVQITEDRPLRVGDKVIVRLTVRADRDFEFVHLRDMRAAAFEPVEQISGMRWQNGVRFYQTSRDASTNFFFDVLPRGTYVFEYAVFVTRAGSYSTGIATIQSMYAPEFISHTSGIRIIVK